MHYPALLRILQRLDDRIAYRHTSDRFASSSSYAVPGLWIDPAGRVDTQAVIPEQFFRERLQGILERPARDRVAGEQDPGDWSQHAVAYNLFIRAGAAWDHDGDGSIRGGPDDEGWRETGTFLKAITLLPFICSLGCNTIHLLPITAIGRDGNKGNLGSPFAIRDPYTLDETLSEPALGLGPDAEFAAFVEAAHHLGLRVVLEFVFRTTAKDSVWAGEHPEWFYWIRADVPDRQPGDRDETVFGAPLFSRAELEQIYRQVGTGQHLDLLPPNPLYRSVFLPPPAARDVELVDGRWIGRVADPKTGGIVCARIPGAFCDWPPDSDQPPWSDVTYLRLYDHRDFNYMAYNTVRIYDARLAQPANTVAPLWEKIIEIIPHYQRDFGIDGVMIDMGHALPVALKKRLVARAREAQPDFALWAEDFNLRASSRAEGYNVCLGPFMQTVRDPAQLQLWLDHLDSTGVPVPFMATPENHNTPRAVTWRGGRDYAMYAMTIGAMLPSVPYIHGGMELAETHPINTGFDFSQEQLAALPAEALPLFSAAAYGWTRKQNLAAQLRAVIALRAQHRNLLVDPRPGSIRRVETGNPYVTAFVRRQPGLPGLLIAGNGDMRNSQALRVRLPGARVVRLYPSTGSEVHEPEKEPDIVLAPAQVMIWQLIAKSRDR